MQLLAICLIVIGGALSAYGITRFLAARRRVLAPGEVAPRNALTVLFVGDVALVLGVLLLFL